LQKERKIRNDKFKNKNVYFILFFKRIIIVIVTMIELGVIHKCQIRKK